MSLRNALRSRFRGDKDKESSKESLSVEGRDSSPLREETQEDLQSNVPKSSTAVPDEEPMCSKLLDFPHRSVSPSTSTQSIQDPDDKKSYDSQLNLLQEQLVAAMIENQSIREDTPRSATGGELNSYKEKNEVDKILKNLEFEKLRNTQLNQQLDDVKQHRTWSIRKRKVQRPDLTDSENRTSEANLDMDSAEEGTEKQAESSRQGPTEEKRGEEVKKKGLLARFIDYILQFFYGLLSDFSQDDLKEDDMSEGDPLTVKKLKENIKRFRNDAKPILDGGKNIKHLIMWRSPSVTLIAFVVYMYSVWIGWLAPVLLSLAIFKLSINFLTHKGWNINLPSLLANEDEDKKEAEPLKDKFNLVVQVARKVQNALGKLADNLEKMKSLMQWRQPKHTFRLYLVLWVALVVCCCFPGKIIFTYLALYIGIKVFIIEYIYNRFPRLKRRHDSTYRIWNELPTDRAYMRSSRDKSGLSIRVSEEKLSEETIVNDSDKGFCELFSLPLTEHPLPGWRGGRRCTLINKDKSLTAAFKNGKLYLTKSYLCFERSKTTAMKNITIPQTEIISIEKTKTYTWMPGGGMSLEVTVHDQEKPYLFGAILNRDDCYESIVANGLKERMFWAMDLSSSPTTLISSGKAVDTQEQMGKVSDTSATIPPSDAHPASSTSAGSASTANKEGAANDNDQVPKT